MSDDARDFNNIEKRAVFKFFLQGKEPKEIHSILIETLGEHAPSHATLKNWVAQFNPLPLLFKTLLHEQKDCVFSAGI